MQRVTAFRAAKKPHISPNNQKARIKYANSNRLWTINDWKRELWIDESIYNLKGPDGILKVRRSKGKCFDPKYTKGTANHGGGKGVMVWGSFSSFSVSEPNNRINGVKDRFIYRGIL